MKKKFQLGAILAAIVLICFDVLVFILNKTYDKQFYLGFIICNVAFIAYILIKLLVKRTDEERGVFPLDLSVMIYAALMMVFAIIEFIIPRSALIFTILLVVNIIFFALVAILVAFGIFTKEHVKNDNREKTVILNENDLVKTLEQIRGYVNNDSVKAKLEELIQKVSAADLDVRSPKGSKVKEYVSFMYRDAVNSNLDNLLFNLEKVEKILAE